MYNRVIEKHHEFDGYLVIFKLFRNNCRHLAFNAAIQICTLNKYSYSSKNVANML